LITRSVLRRSNLTGLEDLSGLNSGLETQLRRLIGYESEENPFNETQSEFLVEALHRCKILDPACGSGAFPMGVLLKMTHILSKLDKNNEKWKNVEIEKRLQPLLNDKKLIQQIGYEAVRKTALEKLDTEITAIETAFGDNEADYARKLYLIENCIYGIDIQPIAVQISKLRFFISLVVNQNEKPNTKNRGILPLPNLETKFVAANTLIGLDKPKSGQMLTLKSDELIQLEKDIADVRKKHFNAQNRAEKEKCRKEDKRIRNRIAEILETSVSKNVADKLAAWNPYNQNTASDFFDMEWMFGIKDGFDVVIGNPPYFNTKGNDVYSKTQSAKDIRKGILNITALFIDFAITNSVNSISFIVPKSILHVSSWGE
jgi:adenine-specific DNA-methyltransferase